MFERRREIKRPEIVCPEYSASEGAMIKSLKSKYRLTGMTSWWVKFKKEADIDAEVIAKHLVKGTKDVYNYLCIIRDEQGNPVPVGRTYNVKSATITAPKEGIPIGGIIRVAFVNLNKYIDPKTGEVWYNWWAPRPIEYREDKRYPDLTYLAERLVLQTRGLIEEKPYPKRYRQILKGSKPKTKQEAEELEEWIMIRFIGTRGEIEEYRADHRFHSAILINYGKEKMLFDFGENLGEYLDIKALGVTRIFLTHSHPDHAHGLKDRPINIPLYATRTTIDQLKKEEGFNLKRVKALEPLTKYKIADGISVIAYPVHHSLKAPSVAYKIFLNDFVILYSNDIIDFKDKKREEALTGVHYYIGDGSFLKRPMIRRKKDDEIYGHTSVKTQLRWAKQFGIRRVFFTHFGSEAIKMTEQQLKKTLRSLAEAVDYEGRVTVARDGLVVRFKPKLRERLEDPFLIKPSERRRWRFVLTAHIRGRSVHLDNRRQFADDLLVGVTHFVEKGLSRDPKDFEDAKALYYKEIHPLIKEHLTDPRHKLLSALKAIQPIEWLTVEGEVKPGEIGATRYETGFFIILDSGEIEFLCLKPYFHEYWYHGKLLNGRYVDRMLVKRAEWKKTGEGIMNWLFFTAKPLPYVLTRRAVKKAWMPPLGHSALPRHIREQIPNELRYWTVKDKKQALKIRDKLVDMLERKKIKLTLEASIKRAPRTIKFTLSHHWWKGPFVIRVGPTREHWDLCFDFPEEEGLQTFVLMHNPVVTDTTVAIERYMPNKKLMTAAGSIPPSTELNPTKETPSFIDPIDMNKKVTILEWKKDFIKVRFEGDKLKGLWALKREQPKAKIWVLERVELPKPVKASMTLRAKCDLGAMSYFETGKPNYLEVKGILLRPGKIKHLFIPQRALETAQLNPPAGQNLVYINFFHGKDEISKVGLLKKIWWSPEKVWKEDDNKLRRGALMFEGVITSQDAINKILNEGLTSVSVEIEYTLEDGQTVSDISVRGMALTDNPACKECKIEQACGEGGTCVFLNR